MPPPPTPPPALTHATAAAAGTLLSTLLTYPLDLVTTRLKVQRQLPLVPSSNSGNDKPTLVSAFRTILHDSQGDPRALYAGLRIDLVKSVVDSFLFFLFYTVCVPCLAPFLCFDYPPPGVLKWPLSAYRGVLIDDSI